MDDVVRRADMSSNLMQDKVRTGGGEGEAGGPVTVGKAGWEVAVLMEGKAGQGGRYMQEEERVAGAPAVWRHGGQCLP